MSEKKYYWLKLKDDFFKRHDVRIIESAENGKDYVLFYLKLLVESVSHNGRLRVNEEVPYTEGMLATITNTNIDIVRSAMKVLASLKLMEVLDDQTIYLPKVAEMTGSESASTQRSRKCREKKALQCNANATPCNEAQQNCSTEKERETEPEKELETEPQPEREGGAAAPTSSPPLPARSERELLVEKYGEVNVKKYELKFKAWQKKETSRSGLNALALIEKWMLEDGVTKPKDNSSINIKKLEERIMEKYRKKAI